MSVSRSAQIVNGPRRVVQGPVRGASRHLPHFKPGSARICVSAMSSGSFSNRNVATRLTERQPLSAALGMKSDMPRCRRRHMTRSGSSTRPARTGRASGLAFGGAPKPSLSPGRAVGRVADTRPPQTPGPPAFRAGGLSRETESGLAGSALLGRKPLPDRVAHHQQHQSERQPRRDHRRLQRRKATADQQCDRDRAFEDAPEHTL